MLKKKASPRPPPQSYPEVRAQAEEKRLAFVRLAFVQVQGKGMLGV